VTSIGGSAERRDIVGAMRDEARVLDVPLSPDHEAAPLRGHIPVLDGVRGLAIAMVLLLHFVGAATPHNFLEKALVTVTGWGQHGVDLFFVLSGFLITGILYDARQKPHFFRNFYMRRVLRIFPLYYGVLAVIFGILPLVPAFNGPLLDNLVQHQAWAWLYGVNVYSAMHGSWPLTYIDHFWSLAVEEHFYFVWPFVVWALGKKPRTLMIASLVVALGALSARIACSVAGVAEHALYVLTPFRLDGLAFGGFLAVFARQPGGLATIAKAVPRVALAAMGLLVVRAAWTHSAGSGVAVLKPLRESLVMIVLACLLMWAVTAKRGALVYRAFTSRPMTFLGKYSYGLYVYHHFFSYYAATHGTELLLTDRLGSHLFAVAVEGTLGFAASILCAYASYELFEKRFLSLKRRFEPERAGAAGRPSWRPGSRRGGEAELSKDPAMALAAAPEKIRPAGPQNG
jgi:peptidoglycan/LPS O-acetylase OafA/YrhL